MYNHNAPIELDRSGTSPYNKLEEVHKLNEHPLQILILRGGVFYGDSVKLYHKDVLLEEGFHWRKAELSLKATTELGRACYSGVVVMDPKLKGYVRISYQAVGGIYRYNYDIINQRLASVGNDTRPLEWSELLERPDKLNPSLHRHIIDDFSEFQGISDYLDRISKAVLLSRAEVMARVLENKDIIYKSVDCNAIKKNLPTLDIVEYDALLYLFTQYQLISSVSVDTDSCEWDQGSMVFISVNTGNVPVGDTVYWELYTPDTSVDLNAVLPGSHGSIISEGGIQDIVYQVPTVTGVSTNFDLYVGIKLDPQQTEYSAVSFRISIGSDVVVGSISHAYPTFVYGTQPGVFRSKSYSELDELDPVARINNILFY